MRGPVASPQKRALDVAGAAVLLMSTLPVFAVLLIALRCSRRGRIFAATKALGLNGKTFNMWGLAIPKSPNGRIDRIAIETSLMHLPKVFNVLVGDMSLVGPAPRFVEGQAAQKPAPKSQEAILKARPGLIGLDRSRYGRLSGPASQRLEISYVENWSLAKDIEMIGAALSAFFYAEERY